MSLFHDPELLKQIIIDHYRNPQHQGLTKGKDYSCIDSNVETCLDDFKIEMLIKNNSVEDANFEGVGCAVSTAAIDILISLIKHQKLEEAITILSEYFKVIEGIQYNENMMKEANAFKTIYQHANRINCAKMPAISLLRLIKEKF